MPEFCARCNHDRRDHFDDGVCTVTIARGRMLRFLRTAHTVWRWVPCPCKTHIPEETP